MRAIKTVLAIFACLVIGEILNYKQPIFALISTVITMRDTVANSISFGIARIISILIGGGIGLAFFTLGFHALPPYLSIPLACIGAFIALYATLVIKNPTATAYALAMFIIVFFSEQSQEYELVIRRMIETVGGVLVALVINKFVNFKGLHDHADEKQG